MGFGDVSRVRKPQAGASGTFWPFEGGHVDFASLTGLLERSAQGFAREALTALGASDHDRIVRGAIAVGTALELLTKAFLAAINPAMLVERSEKDSLLFLVNQGHRAGADSSPTDVRTLAATDALLLAKKIIPGGAFSWNPQADRRVLQVRNAALHLGLADQSELREACVIMTRLVAELLTSTSADSAKFWGDLEDLAQTLLDEAATERQQSVEVQKAAAKAFYMKLTTGLDAATRTTIVTSLIDRGKPEGDHETWIAEQECPVCANPGWLTCDIVRGEVQHEQVNWHDHDVWVDRTALPFHFECAVCGLELEDDELLETDFPREIELEPDTDPAEAWEPDEDLWRDR
jgi:hypothetical protein